MSTLGANTQCWHLPVCLVVLVGVNTGCWHPVLTPTSMSRGIGRCQHWVPTPSVNTYLKQKVEWQTLKFSGAWQEFSGDWELELKQSGQNLWGGRAHRLDRGPANVTTTGQKLKGDVWRQVEASLGPSSGGSFEASQGDGPARGKVMFQGANKLQTPFLANSIYSIVLIIS